MPETANKRTNSIESITCAHCEGSGTCHSGSNQSTCAVCIREHRLPNSDAPYVGLVCSVCEGLGIAESKSAMIQNRFIPFLAIVIAYFALGLVAFSLKSEHLDKILIFASTLVGSIVGYYFGGARLKTR
jgi:hypothetical protein